MSNKIDHYNRKPIFQSVYCYENTEVLINKEDIRDERILAEYESDITMFRQYQLENEMPVKGRFGVAHLKNIHKYIFQDIYPFAGKLRVEDVWKGDTFFCKSQFIKENLSSLMDELKKDKFLKGLNAENFSKKAAYYMSELNMIHPFRKGNGRTIREFIRQLAIECGYRINWALVDSKTLLQASIISVNKDLEPLTECILNCIEDK